MLDRITAILCAVRSPFSAFVVAALASVTVGCSSTGMVPQQSNSKQPNIIIILTDDQGYGDTSCYDHGPEVSTPNIDRIAQAGIRFTDGYVTGLQCTPSRAGLLSGKYQQRYGVYKNRDAWDGRFRPQTILPQALKKSGYTTGMVGKWHLGRYTKEEWPNQRGFDEYYGFLQGMRGYLKPQPGSPLMRNGELVEEKFGYLTDMFNREGVAFVDKNSKTGPFLLYMSYNAPHYPLEAKESYLKNYNTGDKNRDAQLAMMASVDEGVGQLIAALKRNGVYENTLIFFLSDHGGETKRGADNGALRGGKNELYEGGPRVPFLVSWPARVRAGQVSSTPVSSLDIFATAVAAAGGTMPTDSTFDSKSMLPILMEKTKQPLRETLFWQQRQDGWAVRHKDWKLVNNKDGMQLYDLAKDVGEKTNLAKDNPSVVKELEALFNGWKKQMK